MEIIISILGWLSIIMMIMHWVSDVKTKCQLATCIIINETLVFILNAFRPEPSMVVSVLAPIVITIWIANLWLTKKLM